MEVEQVLDAIHMGKCVVAVGRKPLGVPAINQALRAISTALYVLCGESAGLKSVRTDDELLSILQADGSVILLLEPGDDVELRYLQRLADLVNIRSVRPTLVILAPKYNPSLLPSPLQLLRREHVKARAVDLVALLVRRGVHAAQSDRGGVLRSANVPSVVGSPRGVMSVESGSDEVSSLGLSVIFNEPLVMEGSTTPRLRNVADSLFVGNVKSADNAGRRGLEPYATVEGTNIEQMVLVGCTLVDGKWCCCGMKPDGGIEQVHNGFGAPRFSLLPGTGLARSAGTVRQVGAEASLVETLISVAKPWRVESRTHRTSAGQQVTGGFSYLHSPGLFREDLRWFPPSLSGSPKPDLSVVRPVLPRSPGVPYDAVLKEVVYTTFGLYLVRNANGVYYASEDEALYGLQVKYNEARLAPAQGDTPEFLPPGSILGLLVSTSRNGQRWDPIVRSWVQFSFLKIGSIVRVGGPTG